MRTSFSILAVTIGLLTATNASSSVSQATEPQAANSPVAADTAVDPLKQIPHTLQALDEAKQGKYGKLKRNDLQQLETAERTIQVLMQKNPDLTALDGAERTQLLNSQEAIIAIVTGLKSSQLVCTYRQDTGTRFKTRHCMSREMAEAIKKAARESAAAAQRDYCIPGEGNPCG